MLRLRLLLGSVLGGLLMLLILCLGAQNLEERPRLNLGFGRSVPLPAGFVVGVALGLGGVSGGSSAALLVPGGDDGSFESLEDRRQEDHRWRG